MEEIGDMDQKLRAAKIIMNENVLRMFDS